MFRRVSHMPTTMASQFGETFVEPEGVFRGTAGRGVGCIDPVAVAALSDPNDRALIGSGFCAPRIAELLGCAADRVRVGLHYFEFGEVPSTDLLVLPYVFAKGGKSDERGRWSVN